MPEVRIKESEGPRDITLRVICVVLNPYVSDYEFYLELKLMTVSLELIPIGPL